MKIVANVSETPDLSYCVEFCNQTIAEITKNVWTLNSEDRLLMKKKEYDRIKLFEQNIMNSKDRLWHWKITLLEL